MTKNGNQVRGLDPEYTSPAGAADKTTSIPTGQSGTVGLGGLEPPASSLSGFCPKACFPRIAAVACANDVPLETVEDR